MQFEKNCCEFSNNFQFINLPKRSEALPKLPAAANFAEGYQYRKPVAQSLSYPRILCAQKKH